MAKKSSIKVFTPKVKIGKAAEAALAKAAPGGFSIPKTNGNSSRVTGFMKTTQKAYTPPKSKGK